jgi:hypothetical protein
MAPLPPGRATRPAWKELVPKEHGVWAWLVLPLVLALCLAPAPATLAAALATIAGFASAQGLGRALRGSRAAALPTLASLAAAVVFGALAVATAARPAAVTVTLLAAGGAGFLAMALLGGRAPRQAPVELVAIAGFVAIGVGLAWSGDAARERVVTGAAVLFAWLVLGLWWVRRALAAVLSHREPWRAGRWLALAGVIASLAIGIACERVWVGALPLAYGARVAAHRPPASARDAKRIGLTELAWGLAIAIMAGSS